MPRRSKSVFSHAGGNLTLTALFSITGGVLFALLFVNLARYVAATNVVEQAARKAARCVSPTDPDCVGFDLASYQAPTYLKNWYSYQPLAETSYAIDEYDYSATLFKDTHNASYDTFLTHIVTPLATIETARVYQRESKQKLNTHWNVEADVTGRFIKPSELRPSSGTRFKSEGVGVEAFRPFFPHWKESREQNILAREGQARRLDDIIFEPYCRAKNGKCCLEQNEDSGCDKTLSLAGTLRNYAPVELETFSQSYCAEGASCDCDSEGCFVRISSGQSQVFKTDEITVPRLPINPNDDSGQLPCTDGTSNHYTCNRVIKEAAGGSGEWRINSNVAFRVSAFVCGTTSDSAADWDTNDALQLKRNSGAWESYGGRMERTIGTGCEWYSMYLRGPKKAHGGDPESIGFYYDDITVHWNANTRTENTKRLNKVQVSATLTARDGDLKVRGIRYWVYFTDFIANGEKKEASCGAHLQSAATSEVDGPEDNSECQLDEPELWTWDKPRFNELSWKMTTDDGDITKIIPVCDADGEDDVDLSASEASYGIEQLNVLVDDSAADNPCTQLWASCSKKAKLSLDPEQVCGPLANRAYCGWNNSITPVPLSVAKASAAACEESKTSEQSFLGPAAIYRPASDYQTMISLSEMSGLISGIDSLNSTAEYLNEINQDVPGAASFTQISAEDLSWGEKEIPGMTAHPSSPDKAIHARQHFDFTWTTTENAADCSCNPNASEDKVCPVVACRINNQQSFAGYREVSHEEQSQEALFSVWAPPSLNLVLGYSNTPPEGFLDGEVTLTTTTEKQDIDYIYPFKNSSEYQIPDWQADCQDSCPDEHLSGYDSLNAALRAYIANNPDTLPEHLAAATNPEVLFETSAKPAGRTILTADELAALSIPPCTPHTRMVTCEEKATIPYGVYDSSQFPLGPPECRQASRTICEGQTEGIYDCSTDVLSSPEYGSCEGVIAPGQIIEQETAPEQEIDFELARQVALQEIARFDPTHNCRGKGRGCSEVRISTDASMVDVTVSYQFPLGFPLSDLLEAETIPIEHMTRVPLEWEMVGRRLAQSVDVSQ